MRDVDSMRGIHSVRTMGSTKKRSIPRIQSSAFLELYMLQKEKERLLKESKRVCLKQEIITKRLEEIESEIKKLKGSEASVKAARARSSSGQVHSEMKGAKKEWKTMSMNY